MSAQLKDRAYRIQQFLIWLESRHGASLLECHRWLMKEFRISHGLSESYIEDLKFTKEIHFDKKDAKLHSGEEPP